MTTNGGEKPQGTFVNVEARRDLAECLRHLVCGHMTNDDFDDACGEKWFNHQDIAVVEIANFGYGLYSSDLLTPIKLRGIHKVSADERRIAARAILFLQGDWKYEYPTNVRGVVPFWCTWGPGFYLMLGLAALYVASMAGVIWLAAMGLLALIPSVHWMLTHAEREEELHKFQASGEIDIWPFFRREDFDVARRTPKFLTGRLKETTE